MTDKTLEKYHVEITNLLQRIEKEAGMHISTIYATWLNASTVGEPDHRIIGLEIVSKSGVD